MQPTKGRVLASLVPVEVPVVSNAAVVPASSRNTTCPPILTYAIRIRVLQFVNEPRLYLSATASEHTTAGEIAALQQEAGAHGCIACRIRSGAGPCCRDICAGDLGVAAARSVAFPPTHRAQPDVRCPADSGIANKAIDGAVAQYVLPLVPALLSDEDPMPL